MKAAKQPRVGGAGFTATANADADRLRLHNLSPLEGSRRTKKRVGRGYGAGQGGSCGLGMVRVAGARRALIPSRGAIRAIVCFVAFELAEGARLGLVIACTD